MSPALGLPRGTSLEGPEGIGKWGQPDARELGRGHVCLYALGVCFCGSVSVRAGEREGEGMVGGEDLCISA